MTPADRHRVGQPERSIGGPFLNSVVVSRSSPPSVWPAQTERGTRLALDTRIGPIPLHLRRNNPARPGVNVLLPAGPGLYRPNHQFNGQARGHPVGLRNESTRNDSRPVTGSWILERVVGTNSTESRRPGMAETRQGVRSVSPSPAGATEQPPAEELA
jgi:hypothetical protein